MPLADDEAEAVNALLLKRGRRPLWTLEEDSRLELDGTIQEARARPRRRHDTHYVSDRPETARDLLRRVPLAFALAAQINRIWDAQVEGDERLSLWRRALHALRGPRAHVAHADDAAFILHIDAPWGGGKTTFANFIARILNPAAFGLDPASEQGAELLKGLPLDDDILWPPSNRSRRWRVVQFNAWQHEHVSPPWWNFYGSFRRQCLRGVVPDQRLWLSLREMVWRVWSPATRRAAIMGLLLGLILFVVYWMELPDRLEKQTIGGVEVTTIATLIATGGIGALLLGTIRSALSTFINSLSSSADAATLGEADPLHRIQRHFSWFVRRLGEPVLVIVDDLDRCKPEYVVELVRGMLTIFRSPRVIFLLLGDKNWIETAFSHVHKDMGAAHTDQQISFGGRFAEKAIQLSFILPEAAEESAIDISQQS